MSRDAGEDVPPRRPKPKPEPGRPAASRPGDDAEGPSTWRPNPRDATRTKKRPAGGAGDGAGTSVASATERPPAGPSWWERIVFGGVGSGQLAMYCRQLAAYLDSGVDLLKALTNLERQFARTALGPVTGRIVQAVRRGDALAEGFAREPQAFDPLFLSLMRVAEARGGVPETLRMLSRHYEARQNLIRQARSAMIYPLFVLGVAGGVVALLTLWLLPMFLELLRDVAGRGAILPLPSRMLMAFSRFIQGLGWWLVPLVLVLGPIAVYRIYKTGIGKRAMDEVALKVPVFGKLLRLLDTTRFARALSTLLGAGVDVGTSLDLAGDVVQLDPLRRAIRRARSGVLEGSELSVALGLTGRFGPDILAVIDSGEETGKLPESLEHLARDQEEQVAYMVRNMGQLVQPLLVILLGGVVLFVILAVLLPYISILTSLSR